MFETGVVRAIEGLLQSQARRNNRDILSIFFNMKVYCVFSLESPQRGDSNKYIQYTISQWKRKNYLKLSQICNYGICSKGPKNEFETAVVNESSVFEPLKFHCMCHIFLPNVYGERNVPRMRIIPSYKYSNNFVFAEDILEINLFLCHIFFFCKQFAPCK